MGCCNDCTEIGLGTTYVTFIAYASDASGTNFSYTPLTTSKYIAFLSVISTASTPVAADFTGLWVAYYGTTVLGNEYFNTTSTLTTIEVLGTLTNVIPAALTKDGDVIRVLVDYVSLTPSANTKAITFKIGAVTVWNLTDMNDVNEQFGFIEFIITRTSATTISTRVFDNYYDTSHIKTREIFYNNLTSTIASLNTTAATFTISATCATAPDTLTLGRVTVEYDRK
jgi:hypothetical protein